MYVYTCMHMSIHIYKYIHSDDSLDVIAVGTRTTRGSPCVSWSADGTGNEFCCFLFDICINTKTVLEKYLRREIMRCWNTNYRHGKTRYWMSADSLNLSLSLSLSLSSQRNIFYLFSLDFRKLYMIYTKLWSTYEIRLFIRYISSHFGVKHMIMTR